MQSLTRLLLAALITLAPLSVASHPIPCGNRDFIVEKLKRVYRETQRTVGVAGINVVEVWASDGCVNVSGLNLCYSWTILISNPNGRTCVLESGNGYQTKNPEPLIPGEPIKNEDTDPE